MLVNKTGDILKATENIICHQVNIDGVMGGGLALQIARTYPHVEQEYKELCAIYKNDYEKLKGKFQDLKVNDNQIVANCFTQKPNFDTDYEALKMCFKDLLSYAKEHNYSVAAPFMMGCGIAHGNWEEVETIFRNLSGIYGIDISIYKLEEM